MDTAPLVLSTQAPLLEDLFHSLDQETRIRATQCGEIGPFNPVLAGLESALWDMVARHAGLLLQHLIKDRAPDTVPAYASGLQESAAVDLLP